MSSSSHQGIGDAEKTPANPSGFHSIESDRARTGGRSSAASATVPNAREGFPYFVHCNVRARLDRHETQPRPGRHRLRNTVRFAGEERDATKETSPKELHRRRIGHRARDAETDAPRNGDQCRRRSSRRHRRRSTRGFARPEMGHASAARASAFARGVNYCHSIVTNGSPRACRVDRRRALPAAPGCRAAPRRVRFKKFGLLLFEKLLPYDKLFMAIRLCWRTRKGSVNVVSLGSQVT